MTDPLRRLSTAQQTAGMTKIFPSRAWQHLTQHLPLSLAVRELMRLKALVDLGKLQKPILDVGCGDGLFWENLIHHVHEGSGGDLKGLLGIDINVHEVELASLRLRELGGQVKLIDISQPSFSQESGATKKFNTVIANCSIEHVVHLEMALRNIYEILGEQGRFLLFVPAPNWTENLAMKRLLGRVSPRLGGLLGGLFDGFFQHRHLYPPMVWKFVLSGIGFKVKSIEGIGDSSGNWIFERYLPTAAIAFFYKCIFRRYPKWLKWRRSEGGGQIQSFLEAVESGRILKADLDSREIVEYFIVCEKS